MKRITERSINEKQIKAIEEVIEYLWGDEEINYESCGPTDQRNHIFQSLRVLDAWLTAQKQGV